MPKTVSYAPQGLLALLTALTAVIWGAPGVLFKRRRAYAHIVAILVVIIVILVILLILTL